MNFCGLACACIHLCFYAFMHLCACVGLHELASSCMSLRTLNEIDEVSQNITNI